MYVVNSPADSAAATSNRTAILTVLRPVHSSCQLRQSDTIRTMRAIPLTAALWLVATASAQDGTLGALHETLVRLRTHAKDASVTVAKHQLRDYLESRLAGYREKDILETFVTD